MAEQIQASQPAPSEGAALPPLPAPDTHCYDTDHIPPRDVWSWSRELVEDYARAVLAAQDEAITWATVEDGSVAKAAIEGIELQDEDGLPIEAPAVAQQPLTHMQIVMLWGHRSDGPSTAEIVSFARHVERAHGIGSDVPVQNKEGQP